MEPVTYIAIGTAVLGVVFSIIYVVLLVLGITTLRNLRDLLRRQR